MRKMNNFDCSVTNSIPNNEKVSKSFRRLWQQVSVDYRQKVLVPLSKEYGLSEEKDAILDSNLVASAFRLIENGYSVWLTEKLYPEQVNIFIQSKMEIDTFLEFWERKEINDYVSPFLYSILQISPFTYPTLRKCSQDDLKIIKDLSENDMLPNWCSDTLEDINILLSLLKIQRIDKEPTHTYFLKNCPKNIIEQINNNKYPSTDVCLVSLMEFLKSDEMKGHFINHILIDKLFGMIHYPSCEWIVLRGDGWYFKFPLAYTFDLQQLLSEWFKSTFGCLVTMQHGNCMLLGVVKDLNDSCLEDWVLEKVPNLDWSLCDPLLHFCSKFFPISELESLSTEDKLFKLMERGVL